MTKMTPLSRRKLLGRIGVLAAAGYTIPALTTLSMAQAGSGASGGGDSSGGGSSAPSSSGPSTSTSAPSNNRRNRNSGPSNAGGTGGGAGTTSPATVAATCGAENLNDPTYLQCLVNNGF